MSGETNRLNDDWQERCKHVLVSVNGCSVVHRRVLVQHGVATERVSRLLWARLASSLSTDDALFQSALIRLTVKKYVSNYSLGNVVGRWFSGYYD